MTNLVTLKISGEILKRPESKQSNKVADNRYEGWLQDHN